MGKTILVVEDNELNLRLFCDLLNAPCYSAHPVRDGRDALAKAREVSPDLIIMDIQQIGRAHVLTPVTHAHLVCRLLLENNKAKHKSLNRTLNPVFLVKKKKQIDQ